MRAVRGAHAGCEWALGWHRGSKALTARASCSRSSESSRWLQRTVHPSRVACVRAAEHAVVSLLTRRFASMAVSLSVGVRNALTSLQNTQGLAQTIQNRLATGKKVNSALDNPASFFVAAGLQNRGSDLTRLLDDMGQGTKVLEAADKGIAAIKKLIETAQGTLRQVLQSASTAVKITGTVARLASTDVISRALLPLNGRQSLRTVATPRLQLPLPPAIPSPRLADRRHQSGHVLEWRQRGDNRLGQQSSKPR